MSDNINNAPETAYAVSKGSRRATGPGTDTSRRNAKAAAQAARQTTEAAVAATRQIAEATRQIAEATRQITEAARQITEAARQVVEATAQVTRQMEATRQATKEPMQATRQTTEAATEATRQAAETMTQVTRQVAQQGFQIGGQAFEAWAAGTEAALQATFELQNLAINSGLSLIDAMGSGNRTLFEPWADAVRRAQESALQVFRQNVRQAKTLGEGTPLQDAQG